MRKIIMVASMDEIMQRLSASVDLERQAPAQYRVTAPTRYAQSAPIPNGRVVQNFPSALKEADVNKKTGVVTAYLTVYCNDDGSPFVDPYNDIIEPGSFTKTIAALDAFRKRSSGLWLCPSLWQHDRHELIGGIARLGEDSKGVIYEAHLATGVQRAREALELADRKMIGSSYGYDPVRFNILSGNIRSLKEIALHEQSFVSFPANPLAPILGVKNRRNFGSNYSGGEVDATSCIKELQNLAGSMKAARSESAGEYSDEYEDYLWRLKRAEAYCANPAAFIDNSRYNNSCGG